MRNIGSPVSILLCGSPSITFFLSFSASSWRQFRFSVGAPDAEAKFQAAVVEAKKKDKNAKKFPSLFVRLLFSSVLSTTILKETPLLRLSTAPQRGIGTL